MIDRPMEPSADQARATEDLRRRMEAAGCVFEFIVCQLPEGQAASEAHHRAVLTALFEERLFADEVRHRRQTVADTPALADSPFWQRSFDVSRATASPWNVHGIGDALRRAFEDPPYTADCPPSLFLDFCSAVGLKPDDGIEVLDWVGDPWADAERSRWSSYFDAGREWWGVWCLTVWNPARRTLAALAASTTD